MILLKHHHDPSIGRDIWVNPHVIDIVEQTTGTLGQNLGYATVRLHITGAGGGHLAYYRPGLDAAEELVQEIRSYTVAGSDSHLHALQTQIERLSKNMDELRDDIFGD